MGLRSPLASFGDQFEDLRETQKAAAADLVRLLLRPGCPFFLKLASAEFFKVTALLITQLGDLLMRPGRLRPTVCFALWFAERAPSFHI